MTNFSKFYNPAENLAVDEVIVPFKGRVIFKQYIPKKRKCFGIKMFKLCDSNGYTWQSILGEGQTAHSTACDSNPCDSDRTDEEDRRTWSLIIHGQFLFFPWIIWRFGEETDLLLYCQAEQERHVTRPKTEVNQTKKGETFALEPGLTWRQYCGRTRATYACWLIFIMPQRKVISAMREEKP